jgi:hypothetical protein
MKSKRIIVSLIAIILSFLLALAVPVAFAKGGGKGGGGRGIAGQGRAGGLKGGGLRGGVTGGGGRSHQFHKPRVQHRSYSHRHHDHFFFSFGASAFAPAWGWYDPYYYWGPPPYYSYYGYPYPNYYGYPYYPNYWSDPCLAPDPSYAPYCPPLVDNPTQGYSVPPVDYPLPAPPPLPESGGESQAPTPPPESTAPVTD